MKPGSASTSNPTRRRRTPTSRNSAPNTTACSSDAPKPLRTKGRGKLTFTASEDRCPARRGAVNPQREWVIRIDSMVHDSRREGLNGREYICVVNVYI